MDAFGPSISLLPLDGLSLDLSNIYSCSANDNTSTTEIIEGIYFILCNISSSSGSGAYSATQIYIMASTDHQKIYAMGTDGYFMFSNNQTIQVYTRAPAYGITVSLIKIIT